MKRLQCLDELVRLERSDINLQEGYVRVKGKGDRERLLPLTTDATQRYLRVTQNQLRRAIKKYPLG
jgi:site-specific recombinase XerD